MRYGKSTVSFQWPAGRSSSEIRYDYGSETIDTALSLHRIRTALEQPIGTLRLAQLAKNKERAVILISDGTRLCPSPLLLEELLRELNSAGISDDRVEIVVALGLHRKHTTGELMKLTGPDIYRRVRVHNHSPDSEDCVLVGKTSLGTPVEINRIVAEAPLRIAAGNIEPHALVGISGGVKALIPGVASHACIEKNHSLSLNHRAVPGSPDNPIHQDLEEALQLVPIDFLLNVIVDHDRQVLDAVAGHVIKAHREGTAIAAKRFLVPVRQQFDIVVVSPGGAPKDTQLYQSLKAIRNAAAFTKPGGKIIVAAECPEQFGNGIFQFWVETMKDRKEAVSRLKQEFVLGAHKLLHVDELLAGNEVWLYSSIPPVLVELLGFHPVENWQETINTLIGNTDLTVGYMPFGALTYPASYTPTHS